MKVAAGKTEKSRRVTVVGVYHKAEVSGFRSGLAAVVGGISRGFAQIRANPAEIPATPSTTYA